MLLALGATAHADDLPKIAPEKVLERSQHAGQSMVILDVRTPIEYAQGHVPGAINIPHDKLADRVQELMNDKGKEIVVYCRSGRRAEMAAATLKTNGFERLLHMDGDMLKWMEAKLPTATTTATTGGAAVGSP